MRPAPTLVHRQVVGNVRTVDLATEALATFGVFRSTEIPLVCQLKRLSLSESLLPVSSG